MNDLFFTLLKAAMKGERPETISLPMTLTDEEWQRLYDMADKHALLGVLFTVVCNMKLPRSVARALIGDAQQISEMNELLNCEAARLTQLFADKGHRSAILKGQANARLYPSPLSRTPGDIDIWVDGGRESVVAMLREMHLMDGQEEKTGEATVSYHHVHLPLNEKEVSVEVHFRPSSGNYNPLTNRRLQQWLEQEIQYGSMGKEGFNVPSVRFALVMQLAHIQRHFLEGGIGLRQVCDYYYLLKNSTEEDRTVVAAQLKRFGLHRMAGALMWVLHQRLGLDKELLLCETDSQRGARLFDEMMEGGSFGNYSALWQRGKWARPFLSQVKRIKKASFAPTEVMWENMGICLSVLKTLPERIRRRSLTLHEANKRDLPASK